MLKIVERALLHDFSENTSSDAAMTTEPKKNIGSTTKCRSAIHNDKISDIRAVSAGTRLKNIVTKPLSPPVTVSAISLTGEA